LAPAATPSTITTTPQQMFGYGGMAGAQQTAQANAATGQPQTGAATGTATPAPAAAPDTAGGAATTPPGLSGSAMWDPTYGNTIAAINFAYQNKLPGIHRAWSDAQAAYGPQGPAMTQLGIQTGYDQQAMLDRAEAGGYLTSGRVGYLGGQVQYNRSVKASGIQDKLNNAWDAYLNDMASLGITQYDATAAAWNALLSRQPNALITNPPGGTNTPTTTTTTSGKKNTGGGSKGGGKGGGAKGRPSASSRYAAAQKALRSGRTSAGPTRLTAPASAFIGG
jgi:hypothetical protein